MAITFVLFTAEINKCLLVGETNVLQIKLTFWLVHFHIIAKQLNCFTPLMSKVSILIYLPLWYVSEYEHTLEELWRIYNCEITKGNIHSIKCLSLISASLLAKTGNLHYQIAACNRHEICKFITISLQWRI